MTSRTRRRWSPSKAQLRLRLYMLLAVSDSLVLLASHAAAGALRYGMRLTRWR